jgi:magnesium chelatase family protein
MVAAMNPCRCGFHGDPERRCKCAYGDPERYVSRVSGPLRDRLDIQIEMARISPRDLLSTDTPESSAVVRARIESARDVALARNGGRSNAQLAATALVEACRMSRSANGTLAEWAATNHLTARSVHRLMRVARTVADLHGHDSVRETDVLEAGTLRDPSGGADRGDMAA